VYAAILPWFLSHSCHRRQFLNDAACLRKFTVKDYSEFGSMPGAHGRLIFAQLTCRDASAWFTMELLAALTVRHCRRHAAKMLFTPLTR
jgi:hypothetical protein